MIPEQLHNEFFCKLLPNEKFTLTPKWNVPIYKIDHATKWLKEGYNYGILTGNNNLGILDDDTSDKILHDLFNTTFGESFQVRGHIYIRFTNWDEKSKITFYDPNTGLHLGELLGEGNQGVGPGSTHPSGETYAVVKDLPIREIDFNEFKKVFKEYFVKKENKKSKLRKIKFDGDKIQDIPIQNVLSSSGLHKRSFGYQGSHPVHGSTTGSNFCIYSKTNSWFCFRCRSGGGPAELIAVLEGVKDCSEIRSQCFTKEQARQVIYLARSKYGLKIPAITPFEPGYYSKYVNIIELAKKHEVENCPICKKRFIFYNSHNRFYCNVCAYGGGLTKFSQLIAEVKIKNELLRG